MTHQRIRSHQRSATTSTLAPHRWCGECDCRLGPFDSEHAARAFTGLYGDGAAYETYRFLLLREPHGWYLQVEAQRAPAPAAPPAPARREPREP